MTTVTRFAFKNTYSTAGMPEEYTLNTDNIVSVTKWIDGMGNPYHCFYMDNGDHYLMQHDFGAMNDVRRVPVHFVKRKKDL